MDREAHPSELRGVLADGTRDPGEVWEELDEMRTAEREREAQELAELAERIAGDGER